MARPRNTPEKFWANIARGGEGCWPWIGGSTSQRYGVLSYGGRRYKAHRLAWELTQGAIPPGLCVLHRCDNPPCVRPEHLFLGTKADNSRDMRIKGRSTRGINNGRALLTAADVLALRAQRASGRKLQALADEFRVSVRTITCILSGRSWRHI